MHCRPHHLVRVPYFCLVAALGFLALYFYNKTDQQATVVSSPALSSPLVLDAAGVTNRVAVQTDTVVVKEESIASEEVKEEYSTVDTLLFFVGYPRSRHTLLASLLDGHPHMVVANEANMFYRLAHGNLMSKNVMFDILTKSSRGFLKAGGKGIVMKGTVNDTKHFGFFMRGYWQGTYDKYIKVIGDKTAWITSGTFRVLGFDRARELVKKLEETYNVKTKFIHIIRNPFDIISTSTVRDSKQTKRFTNHTVQISEPDLLERGMERFFNWAKGSAIAREALGDKLLDVVGLELVQRPAETMRKICDFIEIACSEDYIQACANVVDPNPSITRHYVVWTKEQKNRVYSEIEQYPFLADYTFDD